MGKTFLVLIIFAIIGTGVIACVTGLALGLDSSPKPSDYVLKDGECWVHPQGDPLYDEHYAKNVNLPNCSSYKTQEQGRQIAAVTRDIEWSTTNGMIGVYSILGVVVVGLFVITALIIKGGAT